MSSTWCGRTAAALVILLSVGLSREVVAAPPVPDAAKHEAARAALRRMMKLEHKPARKLDISRRIAVDHLEEAAGCDQDDATAPLRDRAHKAREAALAVLDGALADHAGPEGRDGLLYLRATTLHELGRTTEAKAAYAQLLADHPTSELAPDALLDIGDQHFDRGDLTSASAAYEKVLAFPKAPVRPFAVYKLAWCAYNLGQFERGMELLAEVIGAADAGVSDGRQALRTAALHDYVSFFAEGGRSEDAAERFGTLAPKRARDLLVELAQRYELQDKIDHARRIWGDLIDPKACDIETLEYHFRRLRCASRVEQRALVLDDLRAWVETLTRLRTCVRPASRDALEAKRSAATRWLGELLDRWKAGPAAGGPPGAVEEFEALLRRALTRPSRNQTGSGFAGSC